MLKLTSKTGTVKGRQKAVYNYISNFRNFAHLLPSERLGDLRITEDTLEFRIDGLGDVGLKLAERHPDHQLVIKAIEGSTADFTFWINIAEATANTSTVIITLNASLNMFLEMIAKGPLQQFLDVMIDKLEQISFES